MNNVEKLYLTEVIATYGKQAMATKSLEDIEALEQADMAFWKKHDTNLYHLIESTYEKN